MTDFGYTIPPALYARSMSSSRALIRTMPHGELARVFAEEAVSCLTAPTAHALAQDIERLTDVRR